MNKHLGSKNWKLVFPKDMHTVCNMSYKLCRKIVHNLQNEKDKICDDTRKPELS